MRTIADAATEAAIESSTRCTHVRVWVDGDGGGAYDTDLSDLDGRNWIDSVEWGEDIDSPGQTARVMLRREEYKASLAPLNEWSKFNQQPQNPSSPPDTYNPAIQIFRKIKIEVATLPVGVAPASTDWVNVFEGRIDDIDWGGEQPIITLACRDQSGRLQTAWVRDVTNYSDAGGDPVQTVMQQILTDWGNAVSLYTPVSPSWNILLYEQRKEPVLDAVRRLAQQIGWDVRYMWDDGTSAWRLTLYGPDRAKVTPDHTFAAERIMDVERLRISVMTIRNRVRIVYTDETTEGRDLYEASDATSIAKYDDQFMEVVEASTSNIDSAAEAQVMADAILADLMEPSAEQQVTVPLFWPAQLGDLYRFEPNGVHYDQAQDLAVVAYRHKIDHNGDRTTLTTRGRPAGAYTQWLRLDARGSVGAATDTDGPDQPVNSDAVPTQGGIAVTYDAPANLDWAYSECHVSTTTGFTPSPATKFAEARTNRFTIGGLIPGETYYIKIIAVDTRGNKSVISNQTVQATALNSPQFSDPAYDKTNMVINGEFNAWAEGRDQTLVPPDRWHPFEDSDGDGTLGETGEIDDTKWGNGGYSTHWCYFTQSKVLTGSNAIKVFRGTNGEAIGVVSDMVPVPGNTVIRVFLAHQSTDADTNFAYTAKYYEEDQTTLAGTSAAIGFTNAANTWEFGEHIFRTDPDARWARFFVYRLPQSGDAAGTESTFDRIDVRKCLPRAHVTVDGSVAQALAVNANTWTQLLFQFTRQDGGLGWSGDDFTVIEPGTFAIHAQVALDAMPSGVDIRVGIFVNGSIAVEGPTVRTSSTQTIPAIVSISNMLLDPGDVVDFRVLHTETGADPYFYNDTEPEKNFATIAQVT